MTSFIIGVVILIALFGGESDIQGAVVVWLKTVPPCP